MPCPPKPLLAQLQNPYLRTLLSISGKKQHVSLKHSYATGSSAATCDASRLSDSPARWAGCLMGWQASQAKYFRLLLWGPAGLAGWPASRLAGGQAGRLACRPAPSLIWQSTSYTKYGFDTCQIETDSMKLGRFVPFPFPTTPFPLPYALPSRGLFDLAPFNLDKVDVGNILCEGWSP